MADAVAAFDRYAHSAFAKLVTRHACRTQAKRTLATFKIWDAHSGQHHALKLLRRKRHGNSNDRTKDSSVAKPMPKGRPFAHRLDFGLAERNRILANLDVPL